MKNSLSLITLGCALLASPALSQDYAAVSKTSSGGLPDEGIGDLAMTGDGRFVVFASRASDLVPGDRLIDRIAGDTAVALRIAQQFHREGLRGQEAFDIRLHEGHPVQRDLSVHARLRFRLVDQGAQLVASVVDYGRQDDRAACRSISARIERRIRQQRELGPVIHRQRFRHGCRAGAEDHVGQGICQFGRVRL